MNTKLYTGNGGTNAQTGVGFKPDLVWIKNRTASGEGHHWYDIVRGVTKRIRSDTSAAQTTVSTGLTAFGTDGFTVGSTAGVNGNGNGIASWNWKAGTSFTNDASSTGIGSIDSSGSFNNDAGFSIVSYTGNSPTATTIKHGLNSIPQMIIFKRLVGVGNMTVYHQSLGNTKGIFLTTTAASDTSAGYFNNTTPTSSVFSVANSGDTNSNGNAMIAYCFTEKQGYSKIGSYTGTGTNVYINTGFKVGWLLVKVSDGTNGWLVIDATRSPANPQGKYIYANTDGTEGTVTYGEFFSNGFGWKGTNSIAVNQSGKNYIYYAIAENPFVASNYNVATAR
tara:strand:+ start:18 stop:1025 length:1008 start_codon:yes stop_codon:yes gene_type:complete